MIQCLLWGVAQSEERLALNQEVAGSIPASPAKNSLKMFVPPLECRYDNKPKTVHRGIKRNSAGCGVRLGYLRIEF